MTKKEHDLNKKYLLENCNNIFYNGLGLEDEPFSAELESYTSAGGDMIISLEELSKEKLQEYIDDFDINYEVVIWWQNGKKGNGVPFDNIKQHYEDVENWLNWLQKEVCDNMPY